ncbi:methyltransferase domain-containing protein [Actinomadura fulvescens]|uniref:Class I SAM-dependent methyltransferase n=1 Tax=Actinomadura fulvescens TaxID=46160 RepID=A0ABP6CE56_9ACTN
MAEIVNTEQAEAWNGYEGRHWADNHERYDAMNSTFNDHLMEAARIGERDRVLDLGCGNGQTTRRAARQARLGSAVGVDLSLPMLTRARATAAAEGVANVRFEQGDVQVHPFPGGGFDVAISRFAVMFFADPVAAFANVARALRPGGRLAFLSMSDLDGTDLGTVVGALAEHLPGWPPEPGGAGPLSLADPAHVRDVLTAAGFHDVGTTLIGGESRWGRDAADAARFLAGWGPVRFHLADDDPVPVRAALEAAFLPFERADGVCLRSNALLVEAAR